MGSNHLRKNAVINKPPEKRVTKYEAGKFIVVFLDLLGQRQAMRRMAEFPKDEAVLQQLVDNSLGKRIFMHDQIQQLFYEAFEKFEKQDVEDLRKSHSERPQPDQPATGRQG